MSENRSEKPTKGKLKKARAKGQVAKSSFLAGALVFAAGVVLIGVLSTLFAARFRESMRAGFLNLKEPSVEEAFKIVSLPLIFPLLIVLLSLFVVAVGAHFFQTGWVWSTEQIQPKWRKKKTQRRWVLPLLQFVIILGVGYLAIRAKFDPRLLFSSTATQSSYLFKKMFFLAIEISVLLLLLGLGDFIYQKWRYYKQMHMTPEEKKEEQREAEGDPKLKGRMRDR